MSVVTRIHQVKLTIPLRQGSIMFALGVSRAQPFKRWSRSARRWRDVPQAWWLDGQPERGFTIAGCAGIGFRVHWMIFRRMPDESA